MDDAYRRAAALSSGSALHRQRNTNIDPVWIDDGSSFLYRRDIEDGWEYLKVGLPSGSKAKVVDRSNVVDLLRAAGHVVENLESFELHALSVSCGGKIVRFTWNGIRWELDLSADRIYSAYSPSAGPGELLSADEKWIAYAADDNLWIKPTNGGEPRRLTWDGMPYYGYAKIPDAGNTSVTAKRTSKKQSLMALWSPDSRRLVTYRMDERRVKELYLLESVHGGTEARPRLYAPKHPLTGDEHVATAEFVIFDIDSKTATWAQRPPHDLSEFSPFERGFVWWSENGKHLYFIEGARGDRAVKFFEMDAQTGLCRLLMEEHGKTYVELGLWRCGNSPLVRILPKREAFIWFSERDGWGHLYLYDYRTGTLIRQITKGAWVVRDIVAVDEENNQLYILAAGHESGRDPYYKHLYRVSLDGSDIELLSPEDADHAVEGSKTDSGRSLPHSFVDTFSTIQKAPQSVIRCANGKKTLPLETADISRLLPATSVAPEPFSVKAADGTTDLYGALFRPATFDADLKYPLIEAIYPGPHTIRTPKIAFSKTGIDFHWYAQPQSLAELGFIVVTLDARGSPFRSKAFHDAAKLEDAGCLEDHISAYEQLAARYAYIDLNRIGITGASQGGYGAVKAILKYPDIYKVAVAAAGNYDLRASQAYYCEKYQGPVSEAPYEKEAISSLAGNLKGKLLIAYADLDEHVNPLMALQLMHKLIEHNKNFDVLVMPGRSHDFVFEPYFIRRTWDYFVEHLLGKTPPEGFCLN